jgi:simple sugar transport system ATP-binding protein
VLITHKLHEALTISDEITVMRRGRVVSHGASRELTTEALTVAMLGTVAGDTLLPPAPALMGAPVFVARDVTIASQSGREAVSNATFTINGGECVGVAAIEGQGQHDLLAALAGRHAIASGTLTHPHAVGYVPADRHRDAVLLDRDLVENVALRGAGGRSGRIDWSRWRDHTVSLIADADVRAASPRASVSSLSGGNQQKLVLARELDPFESSESAGAIVADNPTRGLDVRASAAVHRRLRLSAEKGAAVVVYSSDIDELLTIATRIMVLRDGVLRDVPLDREAIGRAMIGVP